MQQYLPTHICNIVSKLYILLAAGGVYNSACGGCQKQCSTPPYFALLVVYKEVHYLHVCT